MINIYHIYTKYAMGVKYGKQKVERNCGITNVSLDHLIYLLNMYTPLWILHYYSIKQ